MATGAQTRSLILEKAAMLASIDGLERMSLGHLAEEVGMSKSGLFAHFRSKEHLQLAVIETASEIYSREVLRPGLAADPGLPRLLEMCRAFLDYVRREVFPGGCFFVGAAVEFDARSGALHDRIAVQQNWWLETLERLALEGRELGHLDSSIEPRQVAFELEALLFTASHVHQLHPEYKALARAEAAVLATLARSATKAGQKAAGLKMASAKGR